VLPIDLPCFPGAPSKRTVSCPRRRCSGRRGCRKSRKIEQRPASPWTLSVDGLYWFSWHFDAKDQGCLTQPLGGLFYRLKSMEDTHDAGLCVSRAHGLADHVDCRRAGSVGVPCGTPATHGGLSGVGPPESARASPLPPHTLGSAVGPLPGAPRRVCSSRLWRCSDVPPAGSAWTP
jgi:hypothetical protein